MIEIINHQLSPILFRFLKSIEKQINIEHIYNLTVSLVNTLEERNVDFFNKQYFSDAESKLLTMKGQINNLFEIVFNIKNIALKK